VDIRLESTLTFPILELVIPPLLLCSAVILPVYIFPFKVTAFVDADAVEKEFPHV
jgi:hypothetical protein